jgi:hypothetical protein
MECTVINRDAMSVCKHRDVCRLLKCHPNVAGRLSSLVSEGSVASLYVLKEL